MAMPFATFIESAWTDHADHPQEVADRLAGALPRVAAPDDIAAFARLATHVYGEHLGQWQRGIALLEALRAHAAAGSRDAADLPLARGIATLRYAAGERHALGDLGAEDRVVVLATAAAALAGRGEFTPALGAFAHALQVAETGLPAGSPALRSLAIGGNNLAAALEEHPGRTPVETAGMVAAAEAGLKYWTLAGTWLETERAEYRLAHSQLAAADPRAAVASAHRCIAVCEAHAAPAFELFFGHAVLAQALRAAGDGPAYEACRLRALTLLEQVPADERQWCESERATLAT
jgi:hypothetical protein